MRSPRGPGRARPGWVACELVLGVASLGGAALAGYVFVHRPWPNRLDTAGFAAFPANPNSHIDHLIADIGTLPVMLVGIAVAIVLSIWRDWVRAVACAVGPLAAVLITERVAKPLVGRHVTALGGYSYPSGTVTAVAALSTVAILAAPRLLKPLAVLAGLIATTAVAAAVIAMRWHFPTDALGGALVGFGAVLTLDALFHVPFVLARSRTPSGAHSTVRHRAVASDL